MQQASSHTEFIDTTLREGFQGAITVFENGASPSAYAESVIAKTNASHIEIYGPEIYYPAREYESIIRVIGKKLQLYCGTVEKFDPTSKRHLSSLSNMRLSLTAINKNIDSLHKIQQILSTFPASTLRIGIECVGSANQSGLAGFLKKLTQLERVENITLSDSNGTITPQLLRDTILSFPRPFGGTLGFHLHNDSGLAVANMIAASEACATLGQSKISFDYSFGGLGERYGILSLQEIAAAYPHTVVRQPDSIKEMSLFFTEEALNFRRLPYMKNIVHVAASHFDANGKLRPEYQTQLDKGEQE